MLLAEYQMATGDDSFMPGLRRIALEASNGQSIVGSWGHKVAGPDGRLVGYGMMNAPGVPLTISLTMARAAGVKDPAVDRAIERSAKLLRFYIGKGAVPYGDHHPWTQTHEDNGKCGMAGVLFNQLGEANDAEFFSRMSTASHGAERDGGHTGNFFNILWSLPGVDRDLLRKAVAAGLQNQDGRARGAVGGVYGQFSYEEIKPLLPAIREAIITPAPSGIMFDSGVRLAGLDLFAKHRIKEGMSLCIKVMDLDRWGKGARVTKCLTILAKYGPAAKPMLPRLRQLETELLAQKLTSHADQLRAIIKDIENATGTVELRSIE